MLSNLCRNKKPQPKLNDIKPLLQPLAALVAFSDQQIAVDATWALSYITDGSEQHIQAVCDVEGLTGIIIQNINQWPDKKYITPALRVLGTIHNT